MAWIQYDVLLTNQGHPSIPIELNFGTEGSVPIISEPMSITWIQLSFPTYCKIKNKIKKDGSLFEGKKP